MNLSTVLTHAERERLRSVGTSLVERSAEIERLRRLPDDVVEQLIDLEVFRTFVPECYGGRQRHLQEGLGIIEELGYWDGAVGWCTMICLTTTLQAAYLPPEHAAIIFSNPRTIVGGTAEPRGRGRFDGDDLVASGRWAWGSGTPHCDFIGGGCLVPMEGDSRPRFLFAFFERSQVALLDNWYSGGLRGTGSGDFEVLDARVPAGRWVERLVDRSRIDDPLYRFPHFGLLALGVTAVGLGMARRVIDEFVELASSKNYVGSQRTLAQRQTVQAAVAEAQAKLEASTAYVRAAVDEAWVSAQSGEMSVEARSQLRLAATFGMRSAAQITDSLYDMSGSSVVYESCPLERLFRDVHVAATHGMVAHRTYELMGRLALGLETDVRQL